MKAILIDPIKLDVTEVNIGTDYREIYKQIDADTFECITINKNGDAIYIDEEGLLKPFETQCFFMFSGYPQPIAGKGLILGLNRATGESENPTITVKEVIQKVSYLTPYQVYLWTLENEDN